MRLAEAVPMPTAEKFRKERCLRETGACDSWCRGAGGRGRADHVEWCFFASQEERAMKPLQGRYLIVQMLLERSLVFSLPGDLPIC